MNRKNLFRGKHIHTLPQNEHLDDAWVYGYLSNENHIYSPELAGEFLINHVTICQYTNQNDIGGSKIFEHDIVKENDAVGVVKFGKYGNGYHLGYYIHWIKYPHLRNELCYWADKVVVIGNIYDNPELMEVC
ncbi:MAG: hypothetical protein HDR11_15355 [Lachnospiraceae bacterium]|nr:hypothetical protein [Lachnospiraceae bacterium]